MSFVKTLATLAAGFAAAKGYDKYKDMGGMPGVKDAMRSSPQFNQMSDQAFDMMEKMGLPTDQLKKMQEQFLGATENAASAAGMGGLMSALGGGMAGGAEQTSAFVDAMTGSSVATDAVEANAKLMIRAMVQAAKADGEIDPAEQARIMEHFEDASEEELAFIKAELAAPVDPMALARDTSEQMGAQVYATAVMTMRVDNASEVAFLNQLAQGLGLSDETRARVHNAMGVS